MGGSGRARQPAVRANHADPCRGGRRGTYRGTARAPSRRTIEVTVSDDKKAGLTQGLGAEKSINYREQIFVRETLNWTEGKGADVVFDTVGGETFLRSLNAVRIGGKL